MDTITFTKGIASWNEDPEYATKKLNEYDVNFGIIINKAPPLSQEFKINLSSRILYLLRTAEYSQKKIDAVKKKLSISEDSSLNLNATYELIQQQQIGEVSLRQSGIAGKVAESYMQYAIADAVYDMGKNIRFHHSFQTKGSDIQINGNNMSYNTPTEMDFILTYKKKNYLTSLKSKLQEERKINIIENHDSKKSIISYKNQK